MPHYKPEEERLIKGSSGNIARFKRESLEKLKKASADYSVSSAWIIRRAVDLYLHDLEQKKHLI